MRTVVVTSPGILELNWTWLPTWIGSNVQIKKQIEDKLRDKVVGRPLTDATLDEVNDEVIDFLVELNPSVEGLGDYIDGLKFVKFRCPEEATESTSE